MLNSDNKFSPVKAFTKELSEQSEEGESAKTSEKEIIENELKEQDQEEPVVPTEGELKAAKLDEEKFLPEIPSHTQYLIVGGGTAAMSAFKAIRANDPSARVIKN